ncbi:Cytochrome c oxidase assembly protein cox15 [Cadophora gregata]|uniref:Cytochrome c oxidase assembly protein cox15 n=1 Tax=Cadophora gregata TaxID=51156 RepID=UPI0026DC4F22|nr:Cytochrome c oxidase assembly protein cox15 [Cadophora gregata]KAK0120291.1 Cytochrome c oxidase assembly protein cox15 [Cadophora gregata]KAK0121322.1 Cytochrome c oxidase assembly protein cox15 [Cadophora gregata f. sp. sojae]
MAFLLSSLRRTGPKITNDFFICQRCLRQSPSILSKVKTPGKLNLSRSIRFNSNTAFADAAASKKSPLSNLSETIYISKKAAEKAAQEARRGASEGKKGFWPETSSNAVGYWLLASAGSVFGIVVFGGLTRLTESGLSITEWRPVTGSLPPLSQEDWDSEFSKYRASPEFKLLNPHMTLAEFKKIYFMEWGHRLWGRFVGLSFVLPAIYFVSRGKLSRNMSLRLLGISGLIAGQGALGWYMVKSGLKDDLFAPGSHPRVSQYRLTAHLGAAFICYTAMLWNGLSILRTNTHLSHPVHAHAQLTHLLSSTLSPFRKSVAGLALLVFTTAMSGGLVAGLDAGLIYNEFPRMGVGLHPPKSELLDPFYSHRPDQSDIVWRNMLENPSTVQLDHRALATTTFTAVLALWAYTRLNRKVRSALPNSARKGMLGVVHLLMVQVALGISTLIYMVPVPLAAAHQAGSLALLTGVLVLGGRVWVPRATMRLLEKRVKGLSAVKGVQGGRMAAGFGKEAVKADLGALRRSGPPARGLAGSS